MFGLHPRRNSSILLGATMSKEEIDLYIKETLKNFELAMPEVHRQVKVYEDNLKNGTLKPLPNKI